MVGISGVVYAIVYVVMNEYMCGTECMECVFFVCYLDMRLYGMVWNVQHTWYGMCVYMLADAIMGHCICIYLSSAPFYLPFLSIVEHRCVMARVFIQKTDIMRHVDSDRPNRFDPYGRTNPIAMSASMMANMHLGGGGGNSGYGQQQPPMYGQQQMHGGQMHGGQMHGGQMHGGQMYGGQQQQQPMYGGQQPPMYGQQQQQQQPMYGQQQQQPMYGGQQQMHGGQQQMPMQQQQQPMYGQQQQQQQPMYQQQQQPLGARTSSGSASSLPQPPATNYSAPPPAPAAPQQQQARAGASPALPRLPSQAGLPTGLGADHSSPPLPPATSYSAPPAPAAPPAPPAPGAVPMVPSLGRTAGSTGSSRTSPRPRASMRSSPARLSS